MTSEILSARHVIKPWGRAVLPAPFGNPGSDKIGEIWFEPEIGPALPLMIKYLFTSEKLSIQVHPSDLQARTLGLSGGKEECWLVLDAEPGACLGIGTRQRLSADELREAALSGDIEHLMDWKPVERGDFYYIPAGTVHAIGPGVSLIEIQQNSDITYRLYDYGRPRDLHLDAAVAVSCAAPYPKQLHRKVDLTVDQTLVDGPHFSLLLTGNPNSRLAGTGEVMVIPIEGSVNLNVTGGTYTILPGECASIAPDTPMFSSAGSRLLLARARS